MNDGLNIPGDGEDSRHHMADGMSPLQRKFAECYVDMIQRGEVQCKRKAALAAGYAESHAHNAAFLALRNPAVRRFIADNLTEAAVKVGVDRSYVLFKAMMILEQAEANNERMAAIRALELIAKHADVRAYMPDTGHGAPGMASMPFDLEKLTLDEKRTFLALLGRATPNAPD